MSENEWLRIIGILHLFANTRQGEGHEIEAITVAGDIATQALEEASA